MGAELCLLLWQSVGDSNPDAARTTVCWKAEGGIGAPVAGGFLQNDILGDGLEIRRSNALPEPLALHLFISAYCLLHILRLAHLCRWYSPDLEVVRSHEQIRDARSHHAHNPFIKILRLCIGHTGFQCCINHTIHAVDLLLLWQHGYVVLERVWYPKILATNVGNTLMCVPIIWLGQRLINAIVEVFVVGEDDVPADIVKLAANQHLERSIDTALDVQSPQT